ncbi:GNAT family N-acetyltransferase [Carboxylicivirga sp. M1479]|uniref:GNAT family N-acetyltransferase n=1 Tax=Carboxylicivirga sp. M1479 TaxID=2594476 RepID=UPI002102C3D6|nr:GNAT family N-acetyltransferase [Carboxylicivirga sp. M1479]
MITIKSLLDVDFDTIYEAFKLAFSDYEIQLEKYELQNMLQRRGFVAELSFGAFDNNQLVAFTLNGIGCHKNVKTAYDTGTGTIEAFRGRGLASQVFEYSLPYLKRAGVKCYLLEALQHNTKAISVYSKLGFEVVREFAYFVQDLEHIKANEEGSSAVCDIKVISLSECQSAKHFFDFEPSWQNGFESIGRSINSFQLWGAFENKQLVGLMVFEPTSGDVTQLAVDKAHRRKGVATCLLKHAISQGKHPSIKIINTNLECEAITQFLKAQGITMSGKQFEMVKEL